MFTLRRLAAAALSVLSLALPASAQTPTEITVGTLENGTVSWELEAIKARGLDTANGFALKVLPLAGNPATQVAMQGGEVDTIVSDLLWVAQQRGAGSDFVFLPYSTSVGGLMVGKDSPVQTLADLDGKQIGIAGGPVDKSWLILRAWSMRPDSPTGGEGDTWLLGVNWYPTNNTRVSAHWTAWSVENRTGAFLGGDSGDTATIRVQTGF